MILTVFGAGGFGDTNQKEAQPARRTAKGERSRAPLPPGNLPSARKTIAAVIGGGFVNFEGLPSPLGGTVSGGGRERLPTLARGARLS